MLNDFMNLFTGVETETPKVLTRTNNSDLQSHPSYQKGYEAGLELQRGANVYAINERDAIHLRAFAQGYNDAISTL
jgi:hypothetical protein